MLRTAGRTLPRATSGATAVAVKGVCRLMLRFVLAALYVSLELCPQHRFYLSEFCFAKLSLLIQFLKVRQQVASVLPVSNGLIAQFSHYHQGDGSEEGQHEQRNRKLPGRGRKKIKHPPPALKPYKLYRIVALQILCTL